MRLARGAQPSSPGARSRSPAPCVGVPAAKDWHHSARSAVLPTEATQRRAAVHRWVRLGRGGLRGDCGPDSADHIFTVSLFRPLFMTAPLQPSPLLAYAATNHPNSQSPPPSLKRSIEMAMLPAALAAPRRLRESLREISRFFYGPAVRGSVRLPPLPLLAPRCPQSASPLHPSTSIAVFIERTDTPETSPN